MYSQDGDSVLRCMGSTKSETTQCMSKTLNSTALILSAVLFNKQRRCWPSYFDHPRSGVVYNFGGVCLYVCLCLTIGLIFEILDFGSSFSHIRYISREYETSSHIKVIGSRSRSQEPTGRKSLFPQCKNSTVNSISIKHRDMKFACSVQHGVFGNGGSIGVTAIFVT